MRFFCDFKEGVRKRIRDLPLADDSEEFQSNFNLLGKSRLISNEFVKEGNFSVSPGACAIKTTQVWYSNRLPLTLNALCN